MTTDVELRYATREDVPRLSALMGYAFQNDPVSQWLFPDDTERAIRHPAFFSVFLERALTGGTVIRTVDFRAVALWLDVNGEPEPDSTQMRDALVEARGPNYERFRLLGELMTQHHPKPVPHLYLTFIAVAPRLWGTGIGTALLRHKLARLDLAVLPAYLEASSTRSRTLYKRLGFQDAGEPISLPDGPEFYPMWRAPGAPAAVGTTNAVARDRWDHRSERREPINSQHWRGST